MEAVTTKEVLQWPCQLPELPHSLMCKTRFSAGFEHTLRFQPPRLCDNVRHTVMASATATPCHACVSTSVEIVDFTPRSISYCRSLRCSVRTEIPSRFAACVR